ncbi:MAG: hypothetical protein ACC641_03870 [Acidiferrobacterales bacterium]
MTKSLKKILRVMGQGLAMSHAAEMQHGKQKLEILDRNRQLTNRDIRQPK